MATFFHNPIPTSSQISVLFLGAKGQLVLKVMMTQTWLPNHTWVNNTVDALQSLAASEWFINYGDSYAAAETIAKMALVKMRRDGREAHEKQLRAAGYVA